MNAALRLAVAQAERAGEIIKRLRALVSKRAIETRLIDLNQVVGNCMFLAEYDLKERGIEVVQLLSGYPVAVFADSIQLEQVVLNLLSNAMDALRDEPVMKRHVIVHTRREGKRRFWRSAIPDAALRRVHWRCCSIHSFPPSRMGWGWVCPFARR